MAVSLEFMPRYDNDPSNDFMGPQNAIPRCQAARTNGLRCGQPATRGMKVCRLHGGAVPSAIAARDRREKEEAAGKMLADRKIWDFDAAPVEDAPLALAQFVGRLQHAERTLAEMLESMREQQDCPCCGLSDLDPVAATALRSVQQELGKHLNNLGKLDLGKKHLEIEQQKTQILVLAVMAAFKAVLPNMNDTEKRLAMSTVLGTIRELEASPPTVSERGIYW